MTGEIDPDRILRRVPGWNGRAHIVRPLDGGITNRNLLVEVDGDRYVLRLPGRDTTLLEIDRHTEREANERAAALGFAPKVIALVEPEECLVTRFVEGVALSETDFSDAAVLDRVAAMLRAFHATPPLDHAFDAFTIPARHLAAAVSRGAAAPAVYELVAAVVGEIGAAFSVSPDPRCPCHNDLLAANFLRDGEQIWLLDWEYAGTNDRAFDLGNLATNNGLTADAEEALVAGYHGAVTARRVARLRLMKIVSDAREAMWAVVQQGISALDFDYVGYAEEHFDRLLANAAAPGYRALLDAAAAPDEEHP